MGLGRSGAFFTGCLFYGRRSFLFSSSFPGDHFVSEDFPGRNRLFGRSSGGRRRTVSQCRGLGPNRRGGCFSFVTFCRCFPPFYNPPENYPLASNGISMGNRSFTWSCHIFKCLSPGQDSPTCCSFFCFNDIINYFIIEIWETSTDCYHS